MHIIRSLVCCFLLLAGFEAHAAVAYRSSNYSTYATRTNSTLTAPTGIQNGDLILILFFVGANPTPPTATPPAGFTAIPGFSTTIEVWGFKVTSYGWYKIASGESGNYTVNVASSFNQGFIGAYSGVDPITPFSPTPTVQTGFDYLTNATGVTVPRDNSLVIFFSQDWGDTTNTLTGPTGTTPSFTTRVPGGPHILYVADGVMATAGATGNKAITNNCAPAGAWQTSLIVLQAESCPAQTTADSYVVPHGGTCQAITGPNAVCRKVRNSSSSGRSIFVPAKTTAEWTSFYSNLPSGVTAGTCP